MDKAELYEILNGYFHRLGGWLVAITVLGNLLTWLIQHRFGVAMQDRQNKAQANLETYKTELAGKLEAQKASLDAITAQGKTRYDYAHNEQAVALKELYKLCLAVETEANGLIMGSMLKNTNNPRFKGMVNKADEYFVSLSNNLLALYNYRQANDVHLNKELIPVINDFNTHCSELLKQAADMAGKPPFASFAELQDKKKALDGAVRAALGSDSI